VKWDFDGSEAELESSDVEAKYGNSFFDAEVVEVAEDGKVKIKWGHDGSEADLDPSDVKAKAKEEDDTPPAELKEGDKVEAKFEDKFHDAEVVVPQTEDGKVKIKWGFDGSEAEVAPDEVKVKPEAPPEPPEKLLVIGFLRPRLEVELRTLNRIEAKAAGHCAANPKASFDGPGVGISVMELNTSDGTLGRLIGKGGSMKTKIVNVSGCSLEYMGKDTDLKLAYVLGTGEERARTCALLDLLQHSVDFRTRATELPAALQ
ncbi:ECA4, partial [Symbiodinium pilosum]